MYCTNRRDITLCKEKYAGEAWKMSWKIISGIIVILGFLVSLGLLLKVDIRPVKYGASPCPASVYEQFEVEFENRGDKTEDLKVVVWSDKINFINDSLTYPILKESVYPEHFKFDINMSSFPERKDEANIIIYFNWTYKKNFFKTESSESFCKYKKNVNSDNLHLIGE